MVRAFEWVKHKVAGTMGRPDRLSFSRAELDQLLESPDYAPRALVALLERDLAEKFNVDSGVREKYSIKRHTLMVMGQFEKYFGRDELPGRISRNFFRVFLALHDIGKSNAIMKTGDKHNQHTYTVRTMRRVLSELGFGEQEIRVAVALASADPIGGYIKGTRGGKGTSERIGQLADDAGLPFYAFLRLLLVFYQVDAGSYTEDAGGRKSLDHLFVFDSRKGKMDFSPNIAAKIDQLKIYAEAIPVSMWLADHDWHDVLYDNLKAWVKNNKARLDSGELVKGNTFRYRRNLSTGKYQVQLSHGIKEALYTPRSMLLLDHNWHELIYDDLKEWVKSSPEKLESGEELRGSTFRYRRNLSTGKYEVRLSSRIKETVYSH